MNLDISGILNDWPFESGRIVARLIQGADGLAKLQVRLDLGLIQMNADGRPDGQKPFGCDSLLDYFETRAQGTERPGSRPRPEHDAPRRIEDESELSDVADGEEQEVPKPDRDGDFEMGADDCRMLREEAAQYYQRYLALLSLEDYDRVIRDTTRNLRVLDFCKTFAADEEDRTILEQFRPYITLARTRAIASRALTDNEPKLAVFCIEEGLDAMKRHFTEAGSPQAFDDSEEVRLLKQLRESILPKLPVSQKTELKERLARAIAQENYELAAILRDELRQIKDEPPKAAN